jgi:hypothetical protein
MESTVDSKALVHMPTITFYYLLRDPETRAAFTKFSDSQVSVYTYFILSSWLTMGCVLFGIRLSARLKTTLSFQDTVYAVVLLSLNVTLFVIFWLVFIIRLYRTSQNKSILFRMAEYCLPGFQFILPFGVTLFFGVLLNIRVLGGQCSSADYFHVILCNPFQDMGGLPYDTIALLMMLPVCFHIILRDSKIVTFFLTYLVSFSSIISASRLLRSNKLVVFVIIYFLLSTLILYEMQRQNLALFLMAQKLTHSLEENERLADETHATELRHMIGNVAHDLKTVSILYFTFSLLNCFMFNYYFWLPIYFFQFVKAFDIFSERN